LLPHHQVGSGEVVLDFGLVRGLAYYNGIVFEVSHPGSPQPLGGGGRYDGLARDLGGDGHLPALGFAYSLDALAELTCDFACEDVERVGVLVLASSNEASLQAMSTAAAIRNQGEVAEVEVGGLTLSDALSYARRRGLRWVTTVECDGTTRTHDV
jgi:histidyl-tRNA synthetase